MDAMSGIFNAVLAPREEKLAESPVRRVGGGKEVDTVDGREGKRTDSNPTPSIHTKNPIFSATMR